MNKRGNYTFTILAMHTDFQGNLALDKVTDLFIQAASHHAQALGFDAKFMQSHNMAWVLSRLSIEITAFPRTDSVLNVSTWIDSQGTVFTDRLFRITGEDDSLIAEAVSTWAVMDLNSRRPKRLDHIFKADYTSKDPEFKAVGPEKIEPVVEVYEKSFRKILYGDLDVNNHLNSIRYINWILDLFSTDQFESKKISRMVINYLSEGQFGEEIQLKVNRNEDTFHIDLYNMKEQKSLCRAKVDWE